MLIFPPKSVLAIGEAMIEMAPVGDGLYRRAGSRFEVKSLENHRVG